MESQNNRKKKIVVERFRFLIEVLVVFGLTFLFIIFILYGFLPILLDQNSLLYGPLFYILRALIILISIPIALFLFNILVEPQKKDLIIEDDASPATRHLRLYSISEGDYKEQFLYGIIILFVLFIPLDFLIYFLLPEMLEYTGAVLSVQVTEQYLLQSYMIFLVSVIIIQISVAIYEESVSRGFLTTRGSDYFHKMSAVLIASLYFGFMHFAYFFNPASRNYPIWFPFIWFLQTLIVGIMLSILIIRKKKLFPVIFAHALNNIISAHAVWNHLQGNDFSLVAVYLYLPLLICSVIIFIWQFSRIKHGFLTGLNEFKTYFKLIEGESKGDRYFMVFFDILIAICVAILALFLI